MRIAVLMNVASPWSREIVLGLLGLGNEVHIIDFADWSSSDGSFRATDEHQAPEIKRLRDTVASLNYIRTRLRSRLRYFSAGWTLRNILKRCGAEVLLTLYGGGLAATAYASRYRPYVVYAVGSDVLLAKGISKVIGKIALSSASLVCANGNYLAEQTLKLAPDAKLIPLYFGVDIHTFAPIPRPAKPVQIICTRGFSPLYNNEYLIRALALIPEALNDSCVTFVSGGPLLNQARHLADEVLPSGIRNKVRFLGGVSRESLIERLKLSHVYVSTSRSDGTSTSLLEALACGLFPVLSDIPQNREWVSEDARNCILVPLDQPELLARALHGIIYDERRRNQAIEYNRNQIISRASRSQSMVTLASALEALIRRGVPLSS